MILYIFTLLSALSLSLCSGFFSIYGLTALFTGNHEAIIFMGCSLEIAKIVGTVWVHKNWHNPKFSTILKSYMLPAIFILMLITSMGVYGFLSYTHIADQQSHTESQLQISFLEDQIKQEKETITSNKSQLEFLNKGISLYFDNNKVSSALKERKKQEQERKLLTDAITDSNIKINELAQKLNPLMLEQSKIDQKLGPIEFVAKLLFNDLENNTDKAVRMMILLIIFVFDPFAIVMMIAANITYSDLKNTPSIKDQVLPKQVLTEFIPQKDNDLSDQHRTTKKFGKIILND